MQLVVGCPANVLPHRVECLGVQGTEHGIAGCDADGGSHGGVTLAAPGKLLRDRRFADVCHCVDDTCLSPTAQHFQLPSSGHYCQPYQRPQHYLWTRLRQDLRTRLRQGCLEFLVNFYCVVDCGYDPFGGVLAS